MLARFFSKIKLLGYNSILISKNRKSKLFRQRRICLWHDALQNHFFNTPFRSWDEMKNSHTHLGFSPQNRPAPPNAMITFHGIKRGGWDIFPPPLSTYPLHPSNYSLMVMVRPFDRLMVLTVRLRFLSLSTGRRERSRGTGSPQVNHSSFIIPHSCAVLFQ